MRAEAVIKRDATSRLHKPPNYCCGQYTRSTGHGRYICNGNCGKKYDRFGRQVGKPLNGVDIDRIHFKLGAVKKIVEAA